MSEAGDKAVEKSLVEAEALVRGLVAELQRMRSAAELMEESGSRNQTLAVGLSELVPRLGELVGVVGKAVVALDDSSFSSLGRDLRSDVNERLDAMTMTLGDMVGARVDAGVGVLLEEIGLLRGEVAKVYEVAERGAGRKGLVF